MSTGTIKKIMPKGFGFITVEGEDAMSIDGDLFFHYNDRRDGEDYDPREGDKVSFEIVDGRKGKQAANVALLEEDGEEMEESEDMDEDMDMDSDEDDSDEDMEMAA